MNLSNLLELIGIAIGLIALIPIFITGYYVYGILVAVVVAGLIFYYWDITRPDFTVISHNILAEIKDKDGKEAVVMKKIKVRANHRGKSEYVHRNISCDGEIIKFETSFDLNPRVEKTAGDYMVYNRFPISLRKWQTIDLELIQYHKNSFPQNPEGVIFLADFNTKMLSITVKLPPDRPCR